jgi:hypothetical protein
MPVLKLHVEVEKLRLSAPFRISGFVFEEQEVLVVTLDAVQYGPIDRRRIVRSEAAAHGHRDIPFWR